MKKFIILIPLYNDWKSASKLLEEIDLQIIKWDASVSVITPDSTCVPIFLINVFPNRSFATCLVSFM